MRHVITTVLFTVLVSGLVSVGHPRAAFADVYDGNWTVLVMTVRGTCDRGYRYGVHVANGLVSLTGSVTPTGQVRVSIRLRDRGADGAGHLSENAGVGSWHGNGPNGTTCAGTWEAERR
jgi:hypothetical protein